MAVITPNTDVYLLKVPLEIDDNNQLTFSNATAQHNYFNSLPKLEVHDFTYQRKDGVIRFNGKYDELINYNYVMYRNDAFSDKWFYAYITGMEWKSPNCTEVKIKTDVWQSWQFDISFKPVLIDREHVNDDTVGANTLPESLELGEMVTNGDVINFGGVGGVGMSDFCVVVEVSQVENEGESSTMSYTWESSTHAITPRLNSIDRGTTPLCIGILSGSNTAEYVTTLYDFAGLSESIVNVYMLPKILVGSYNQLNISATRTIDGVTTTKSIQVAVPEFKNGTYDIDTSTFSRPSTLVNYTPKNNKLLTYPYCYFNISNNAGTVIPFHYEDFDNTITFKTEGTFGLSGSTKTIPQNYKNISSSENALDYSVSGAKYPVCSWKSDSYTNWLTQNAVNMETQWQRTIYGEGLGAMRNEVGLLLAGANPAVAAGLSLAGYGASLIGTAREQHMAKTQANMVSDQSKGNMNSGDFLWAKYRSPFTFMPMCIKPEYSKCIDQFFSQFGYKCNQVKVPNINGRRNWNYVKTVGCYIGGDLPQEDMSEIKAMFDRGVTLWHNPATFADYSQNNDII